VKPLAILCNGNSLAEHARLGNLKRIPCDTMGLNRSWELHESTCHLMVDPPQWAFYREARGLDAVDGIPHLITSTNGPGKSQVRILGRNDTRRIFFSWEPFIYGAWLCGTVTWVALQLAVAMQANPIFFLGLDLQPKKVGGELRGKFWGGTWPESAEARQRELLGYAVAMLERCGVELVNVVVNPDDSRCESMLKRTFEHAFRGIERPVRGDGAAHIESKTRP